ncbi:MAG: hypothetical protein U0K91_02350 [Acutalibacteraceae bacterium]|nr:hypothetical protein [Acutalibacteraceae bacterium]
MAITFYGAKLRDDGSVLDNRFIEFNIAKASQMSFENVVDYVAPDFIAKAYVEKSALDVTPIDWHAAFLSVFDRTNSDNNDDLVGEEITFFKEANVNADRLGFTMKLVKRNGNDYTYIVGRRQNGIGMIVLFESYAFGSSYKLSFIQNSTIAADTFEAMLANEETLSRASLNTVRNLNSADKMLFAPYTTRDADSRWDMKVLGYDQNSANAGKVGLFSFNNWYTMIMGQYKTLNMISLDLAVPTKKITKIDLTLPVTLEDIEAKVYTKETNPFPDDLLPYVNYCSMEFQYGTDILYLLDDIDTSKTYTIALKNGELKIAYEDVVYSSGTRKAWVIKLLHNDISLNYVCSELKSLSHTNEYRFEGIRGIYMTCPPDFAAAAPSQWIGLVGEINNPYLYEYPYGPLNFFSEVCNLKKASTDLTYVGVDSEVRFGVLTTNYRNLEYSSAGEMIGYGYIDCYASGVDVDKNWWISFLEGSLPRRTINVGEGSVGGGISGSGGGAGSFDDSSDSNTSEGIFSDAATVIPNTISKIPNDFKIEVGQMYTLLYMDDAGIVKLAEALWKDSFLDYIKSKFSMMDPASLVMSVKLLPYFPGIDSNNLQIQQLGGFALDEPINCREAYAYTHYNAGEINIDGYFDCFLDYTNTRIQLFLPFVGDVELSTSDVMNHTLKLRASFDNMAGIVVYMLTDENDNIIGSWNATCTVDIPLTSGDYTGKIDGMIQAAVQAGAMAMTAGASSVAFAGTVTETATVMGKGGAVTQTSSMKTGEFFNENTNTASNALTQSSNVLGNALNTKPGSGTSSSYSGIAGVLSHLRPCIKITSNKSPIPADYKEIQGYPSNVSVQLSECSGYTEINTVHLENMGYATAEEIAEIEEALKRGVIF